MPGPCRNPRARRPRPPSRGRTVVQGPVGCPPTSGGPGGKWELRRQSSLRGPNNSMSIKLRELIRAVRACNTITKATWTPHYIALRQNRPRRTCRNSERMRLDSYSIQRKCNACASSKRGEIALHPHAWCVHGRRFDLTVWVGYPSHFGQMECLKLIASPNFPEKRIGEQCSLLSIVI